ncbi:MAG: PepSY-like domain-containing protein [Saprospirales bacterium]|nr:PepSY-like domain-containing protein [Saprospirales bacterium]MBK8493168.1 PepSY-like domain-containing protein [Saprospirales bacterium]
MKYLVASLLLSFGLFFFACSENEHAAPAEVQIAFDAKFPTVEKVKWDKEGEGEWEAEFTVEGLEMSANFKTDGTWLETETEMKADDLPQEVTDAIGAQFADYKMEGITMVEMPDQATAYEVELEKDGTTIEATFNADGALLKQQTVSEEDKVEDKD